MRTTKASLEKFKKKLKKDILVSLSNQGFAVGDTLKPKRNGKNTLRKIHDQSRREKILQHKKTLLSDIDIIKKYAVNGRDIDPSKIKLRLIEVKPESEESKIFFWWNLVWWSLPYERPIGRQMRFIIWDDYYNAPFGLIGLQSPPLRSSIRDKFLGLNNGNNDYWINQSMYAQRLGALPPYNSLLGGKMVALTLISKEIRKMYENKYDGGKTLLKKRKIPSRLLFITTTSAFGKSSIYDRVKFNGKEVSKFIGFTSGSGTFHLSEELYQRLLKLLEMEGFDVKRGYGTGPSRKLKLISKAFSKLGLPPFSYHNIKRGFYFFTQVENLEDVIKSKKEPKWINHSLSELNSYWSERWACPRSLRTDDWKKFDFNKFLKKSKKLIEGSCPNC